MQTFKKQTNSQKWSQNKLSFNLTLADMDIGLYSPFKTQLIQRITNINNFTYKYPSQKYLNSIKSWYQSRHMKNNNKIDTKKILPSPSLLNMIYITIMSFTKQKDSIIIFDPVFSYYSIIVRDLNRNLVTSELKINLKQNIMRLNINFQDFQNKAKDCKLLIFCNPHNPSGRIWTQQQINRIIIICRKYNILILSDQILSDLTPLQKLFQFYSLLNSNYENIIVGNSISKAFNCSSLKGGYVIIKNQKLKNQYHRYLQLISLNLNQIALIMTEICYSDSGNKWLTQISDIIKSNYKCLLSLASRSKLIVSELQTGYIVMVNFVKYQNSIKNSVQNKQIITQQNGLKLFLQRNSIKATQIVSAIREISNFTMRFTIAIQPLQFSKFLVLLQNSLKSIDNLYKSSL